MLDKFKQHLQQAGQSVTTPRLEVFIYLQQHAPTTIAGIIAATAPKTNQASVYRTLNLFRELNIIHDIVAGGRRMVELTDSFDSHHHHLTCLRCGRITILEDNSIETRLNELAALKNFEPISHQIEVNGVCANCRTNP